MEERKFSSRYPCYQTTPSASWEPRLAIPHTQQSHIHLAMARNYVGENMQLSRFGVLVAQLESIVASAAHKPPDPLLCFDLLSDLISAVQEEPKVWDPRAFFSLWFWAIIYWMDRGFLWLNWTLSYYLIVVAFKLQVWHQLSGTICSRYQFHLKLFWSFLGTYWSLNWLKTY